MKNNSEIKIEKPDRVLSYFALEKWTLVIITLSGILYNVGMIAGPWFEGQLVQRLLDIMAGRKVFEDMLWFAGLYIVIIAFVQGARFIKRLYVRKFANHINCSMKQVLYGNIVSRKGSELQKDGTGNIMTKAISDVDTCVEGMRKFTTEVFDTGVVMIAYIVMLMLYDWRLALLSLIFPPVAYIIAEKLKGVVSKSASAYKKSAGKLNASTLDRISNAMTYRVYGQENHMNELYENSLSDYEKKAAYANIWETAMQPIYQIVSTLSVIFILWFGAKNILGTGWTSWDIAAFTTFLSCFLKLAVKFSKAAKLFNAVQKAKISWKRIKPYLEQRNNEKTPNEHSNSALSVKNLSFTYPDGENKVIDNISFDLKRGEIMGVAGPVACGKSTLGKIFLCEENYGGNILLDGEELFEVSSKHNGATAYMGHKPELLSASIEENILLGKSGNVMPYVKAVCMDGEIAEMPDGLNTVIGSGGVRLSGGQQARIALARTLFHKKEIIVLDDPFSAVDITTEKQIMANIKPFISKNIVILISHRLELFPELDKVLWLENKTALPHDELMKASPEYKQVYTMQIGGGSDEK